MSFRFLLLKTVYSKCFLLVKRILFHFSGFSCVFCIFVSFFAKLPISLETLARCGKQREGETGRETKSCSQGACEGRGGVAHTVRSKEGAICLSLE